ncbi:UDP-2,4-diacetamido-2,4,6-trideoxy-beta-L-altropyranose hydrolase [Marinomonas piezotolerans]|uniref:UDP-2,4-diacetamido-2,4, 6-trideoxy-beta-L-altropyranose hydrolase n=1 Tax=Marinomonas piezotolerans TaxID=2213058 RepID=A0A370U8T9_9GAMM|nr:UDP-2,4-diacetamido-2,4,6-trideoxy-beta-L-altropyranose hydrolase [Marinomonas piezotolerans]RDL44209.1 UDP-2,4-diacetamido-2,4,6-trideoxy-beta-L-altropyranose hydrolase [Marinomonas piezotolerans]
MGSTRLNVVIRADASIQIGMGHRVRSEVLAEAFSEHGADVCFVVHDSCADFAKVGDVLFEQELEWHELAQRADVLVLDHYGYDLSAINQLFRLNPNLLVLDDNNNRGNFNCRWLLNPLSLRYSNTVLFPLVGPEFALLRPQFNERKTSDRGVRNKLLLTFGGTDSLDLTLSFIKSLFEKGFPSESLLIMVGSGVQNAKEIQDYCRQHHFECHKGVSQVSELMEQSRFAISAAGGTLFELACMGVPTHFIQVAENQKNALDEHALIGWCSATNFVDRSPNERLVLIDQVVDDVIRTWQSDLTERVQIAERCIDGQGAQRVAEAVLASRLIKK